jgi:hypothetical protein
LRFTQVTAASTKYLVFKLGLGGNEVALEQAAADTGGTLAKNCIFDPHNMRLRYTVGGTNPIVYRNGQHSSSAAQFAGSVLEQWPVS